MIYSRMCEHALAALVGIMQCNCPTGWCKVNDIAARARVPSPTLAKVLRMLTHLRFLQSFKGPVGGFRLRRPADQITLYDVVTAIDGVDNIERCAMGWNSCGGAILCPMHPRWIVVRAQIVEFLKTTTLADIAAETRSRDLTAQID